MTPFWGDNRRFWDATSLRAVDTVFVAVQLLSDVQNDVITIVTSVTANARLQQ